jgi:hypothetical protein
MPTGPARDVQEGARILHAAADDGMESLGVSMRAVSIEEELVQVGRTLGLRIVGGCHEASAWHVPGHPSVAGGAGRI